MSEMRDISTTKRENQRAETEGIETAHHPIILPILQENISRKLDFLVGFARRDGIFGGKKIESNRPDSISITTAEYFIQYWIGLSWNK